MIHIPERKITGFKGWIAFFRAKEETLRDKTARELSYLTNQRFNEEQQYKLRQIDFDAEIKKRVDQLRVMTESGYGE